MHFEILKDPWPYQSGVLQIRGVFETHTVGIAPCNLDELQHLRDQLTAFLKAERKRASRAEKRTKTAA